MRTRTNSSYLRPDTTGRVSTAFAYCSGITSVTIEDGVITIGSQAFDFCISLTSIIIPDSVTTIEGTAFGSCLSLTSVTIGEGVTSLGRAFEGCEALTSLIVEEGNETYRSIEGNLYSKDGKTLIKYAIGKEQSSFILPEQVEVIDEYAFSDSINLVRIIIQDSLNIIQKRAFNPCQSLMEVFYTNSPEAWAEITIYSYNADLTNATFTYNYCIPVYSSDCDTHCNKCGEERGPKAEHEYDGDCDAFCKNCFEERETTVEHTYDNACDADCNVCGETRSVAGHTYDNACDTDCNTCGAVRQASHSYKAVVTAPTCTAQGYTTYTCTVCGDCYASDHTDPIEHNYKSVTTDPTCAEDGQIVYTCTECGDSYDEPIPATGEHVYDSDTDADCNLCGEKREVTLPGDMDGNGKVNNRDLGLLQQYLNGNDMSGKTFDLTAIDLDGNGKINNRDLGLLQKLLNQ